MLRALQSPEASLPSPLPPGHCRSASERCHHTIAAWVGSALVQAIGLAHDGAGVAHGVAEVAQHLDIVPGVGEGLQNLGLKAVFELQRGGLLDSGCWR